jgi:hypothetical protein
MHGAGGSIGCCLPIFFDTCPDIGGSLGFAVLVEPVRENEPGCIIVRIGTNSGMQSIAIGHEKSLLVE